MQGPGQLIPLIEETSSTECRQDVATNLLKLFLGQGLAKDFLDLLFQLELSRTSETNTLFRSNSLASKSMESFLKVAGMQYLHGVLVPIINKVFEEKKYVELDPSKVEVKDVGCSGLHRPQTEAEVLEQSAQTLRAHLGALLSALSRSVHACPAVVRATFRQLFRRVRERFPGAQHENVPFIAVTSFLCLRFFRHRVVQALPPAGAPRGRPHQPHPAPVGQGSPERGQHGHAGFQGQGGLDGAAAAHRAPGRGAAEGLHHQARGHRGEGRAGPAADAEFAGATCEGGATLHPQDQGQGPPHVLLLQEALLLPHYRGPQLREDAQLQGQPQCGRPCAPSGVRSTKCTCRPPSTLWLSTSWMRMPSAGTLSERSALQGTP
ncbi:ras GTPase-activating protein 4-like isoform X3 [Pan paniscus]